VRGQAHLLIGAEQDDVGQRRFHRVTDPARTLAADLRVRRQVQCIAIFACVGQRAEVPTMAWIDIKRAGE